MEKMPPDVDSASEDNPIEQLTELIKHPPEIREIQREHIEFKNCLKVEEVKQDVEFLNLLYKDETGITPEEVDSEFCGHLAKIGSNIYHKLIQSLTGHYTSETYIKNKTDFINSCIPGANPVLFSLAWNGLVKNSDGFRRLLKQRFSLKPFKDELSGREIPNTENGQLTRYRTKLVLADDMAQDNGSGQRRKKGRTLDDGSGLDCQEGMIWMPNNRAVPLYEGGIVPTTQTHLIAIRHGKSKHESGGKDALFVGSGKRDGWKNNSRQSGNENNYLNDIGKQSATELGKDFKVAVDTAENEGYPFWVNSQENPIRVFGSESVNTKQTIETFMDTAGFKNLDFKAIPGLNSQKYGALTHLKKSDITEKAMKIYGISKEEVKTRFFKNRFYHFPEGESLIEADWRIAQNFVATLKENRGKRIVLCDHSGALRVLEAIIKGLSFEEYRSLKLNQDTILGISYEEGKNPRFDRLSWPENPLRNRD